MARARVFVGGGDGGEGPRRRHAQRRKDELADRILDVGRAEPERGDDARRRGRRVERRALEAPAPSVARARHGRSTVPSGQRPMPDAPALLARGPWEPDAVEVHWREDAYAAPPERLAEADAAIAALRDRGSPSHDGLAARLVGHAEDTGRLRLELQPVRWALRLVPDDASLSLAALCVTRAADGRWLAGRRAPWLSSWAGRWALGAGGAVEVGESPVETLTRELHEEWSVAPERVRAEALVRLPHRLVMFIGQAWLSEGARVTADHEHDAHAWWPAAVDDWPPEADEPLRRMARLLA
jgi:8-oxo-dGTP diphosphatase